MTNYYIDPDECDYDEDGNPVYEFEPPTTVTLSFPGCTHQIQFMVGTTIPPECPNCSMGVQDNGRCEDFPCCGHTLEEGCGYQPSHTSDYWREWISNREAAGYDLDDPDFYPGEEY